MKDIKLDLTGFMFLIFGNITLFMESFLWWVRVVAGILTVIVALINIYKFVSSFKRKK